MKIFIALAIALLSTACSGQPIMNSCCLADACTKFPVYADNPVTGETDLAEQCWTPTDSPNSCFKCVKVGG